MFMTKRLREFTILLALIAVVVTFQRKSEPPEAVDLPRIDKAELNISGLRPGMTLEEAVVLHGRPNEEYDLWYQWGNPDIDVWCNQGQTIVRIEGYTLNRGNSEFLSRGMGADEWLSTLGKVEPQIAKLKNYCGFAAPRTWHSFHYPDLGLYLDAGTEGFIWQSRLEAWKFNLTDQELVLTGDIAPIYSLKAQSLR